MEKILKVVVDFRQSLTEMIKSGNYDWIDDDINDENFTLQGVGQHEVDLVLVHLQRNATIKEVREHLNAQGLTPARIEHLLAFGAKYPEIQKEFRIVAINSVWIHEFGQSLHFVYHNYPHLSFSGGKRYLICLSYDRDNNFDGSSFLAIRK